MHIFFRHFSFSWAGLFTVFLLTGCYSVHQGRYVAEEVSGWKIQDESDGGILFRYPTKGTPDWFIQIRGDTVGTVHLWIGSHAYASSAIWKSKIEFSGESMRIIYHDGGENAVVPVDGFRTPRGQDVQVGNSQDFTLIVPSFKIGDNDVPELSTRIRWNNDRYRVWIPLQ